MFKKKSKENKAEKVKNVSAKQASFDFVQATKQFEESRISDIEKSKVIAWRVAVGACVVACCCAVALMMLTPLKEVRPYVVRVDNNTGETDIVTMLENGKSNYEEELAKYFSSLYVQLSESYDWYTIQNQIDKLMMFSNKDIQNRINNKFAKPNAPHKVYQESKRVEIKITNTSIIDENGLIQVRFTKAKA